MYFKDVQCFGGPGDGHVHRFVMPPYEREFILYRANGVNYVYTYSERRNVLVYDAARTFGQEQTV